MSEFEVSIRPAETSDAIGLAQVQVETWRDAYVHVLPNDALVDLDELDTAVRWTRLVTVLEEPERLSVAEVDGNLVGFCHGGKARHSMKKMLSGGDRLAEVYALYVDPSFQGMGIGRALLGHVAQGMAADGFEALTILTLAANRQGRRFYDALGGVAGEAMHSVVKGTPVDQTPYMWNDISKLVRRIETAQS